MANRPFLLAGWTEAQIAWTSDNIKVFGASAAYTPDTTATGDHFLSAVPGGAIICTSANLSGKTDVGGALDASDVTFSSVTGVTITQFAIYKDTGSSATSPLILEIDTASGGLPVVPNGGNIGLQWAEAPNFVMAFYFKGLSDREKRSAWDFFRRIGDLIKPGIVDRTPSGIWIGEPTVVQYGR